MKSLKVAISRNRRRWKYRRLVRRIQKRRFVYADAGLGEKSDRVIAKLRSAVQRLSQYP